MPIWRDGRLTDEAWCLCIGCTLGLMGDAEKAGLEALAQIGRTVEGFGEGNGNYYLMFERTERNNPYAAELQGFDPAQHVL